MKKDTQKTVVIFRKWNKSMDEDRGIFSLFPNEDWGAGMCASYAHIGQHGGADYNHCVRNSTLATPEEYADLKKELEGIGYNLKVSKRKKCQ